MGPTEYDNAVKEFLKEFMESSDFSPEMSVYMGYVIGVAFSDVKQRLFKEV